MAIINASLPTLLDHAKRLEPDGSIAKVVELLQARNPVLQDAVFQEGNLPTGHRFSSRTALPSVGWRRFNQGVAASKSRAEQVDETCGMLAARSEIDVDLAKLNGNDAAFRASEEVAFLQAMNQEVESSMFYASSRTAPEKFMGLAPRFDVTSGNPASSQIIKVDGSASGSDQTSIWLVCWGPDTVFGIYPKGSMAGLDAKDMGEDFVEDADGNSFPAYRTYWTWKVGLVVKDWRYVVRICNIDTSAISATGDTLIPAMINAYTQLYDRNMGRPVFYVNRKIESFLWNQARTAVKNSLLSVSEPEGRPVLNFMGIPVKATDSILNTEAVVS